MNRKEFLYTSSTLIGGLSLGRIPFPAFRQSIRIGLITDLHYAERDTPEGSTRFYRESLKKLSECITVMNREKVDFLIQLGDFKDQDDPPEETETLAYLRTMANELSHFNGPIYHVLGNHDHDSISKQQFLDGVTISGFNHPKSYYSFDKNGFHFIVLDANYTATGEAYDHGNFDWKDANIPQDQLEWLRKDLKRTRKPTIVFVHQRLDEKDGNANYCVRNASAVREILEKAENVTLVLQGHYHPGDMSTINGIVYYTLKAAVEGSGLENNSFAILEIDKKLEMNVIGYHKTESRLLRS
ncbi:metallophosphoesterase [Membranicola marinus]|uniref:Metallophosphoesterase n=1 Tax=Membranihabitans marinus TaxID=1227546 RepID=A0A953HP53_9BACT|nr:metallophosphoesterase [Membranihabitans marinus]MBY5958684.1 metallophosphoesterase [Membranihabitans marinus]